MWGNHESEAPRASATPVERVARLIPGSGPSVPTWALMVLTSGAAIGLAMVIGPVALGADGDLVVSVIMAMGAWGGRCGRRKSDVARRAPGVFCYESSIRSPQGALQTSASFGWRCRQRMSMKGTSSTRRRRWGAAADPFDSGKDAGRDRRWNNGCEGGSWRAWGDVE